MKKLTALLLILIVGISMLGGCGDGNGGENGGGSDVKNQDSNSGGGIAGDDNVSGSVSSGNNGEIYDTGTFSVFAPEGWLVIPFTLNGEPNPDALGLYKGAQNEYGMADCPGIQIYYPAKNAIPPLEKHSFTDAADLSPLILENYTWEGFTGKYLGSSPAVLLNDGDRGFQVAVYFKSAFGEETISLDDADVLAIIGSISRGETGVEETGEILDRIDYTFMLASGWEVTYELDDYLELRDFSFQPSDCTDDEAVISFDCRLNGTANEEVAELIEKWPDSYKQVDNFICNGVEYLRVHRTGGRVETQLYTSYKSFDPDSKGYIRIYANSIDDFDFFLPLLETITLK